MASAPSDPGPVLGRVDKTGRLVAADPLLERLQVEAGSRLGASLALPQLAAVVRVAQRLRIPVSRRVLSAGQDQDIDMWVRAVPEGEEVALAIESWTSRPASPPRLATIAAVEHEKLDEAPFALRLDEQLRIVSVDGRLAELLAIDARAAIGQPLTKLFRLEEDEEGELPLLSGLSGRAAFAGQRVTCRSSGKELVLSGEAATAADGAFSGFDISAAAAGAEQPDQKAHPIVDGAIHSALSSPLDAIVRSAEEMAASGASESGDYADYAADIAAAARHLLSVISSLSGGPGAGEGSQVNLVDLASDASALLESAASEREIVVAIQPGRPLLARAEQRGVVQILVNLIGNAIRHSDRGTAVTISFAQDESSVLVHVADEGPGIDPADHKRIFEPFQQGRAGSGGSGLGLSIARRLARAMGGDIQLQSTPGEGARFTLVLPAA
jgi:signal transduction histidine kinase